jgi:hypothetical protein
MHEQTRIPLDFGLSQVKLEDDLSLQQDPTAYAGTPLWFDAPLLIIVMIVTSHHLLRCLLGIPPNRVGWRPRC